ncbi:MAG TPA: hypothetical protein VFF06_03465 [Polyangia bacterium]|nr:hypothetical protein [Polyangia bacterium]
MRLHHEALVAAMLAAALAGGCDAVTNGCRDDPDCPGGACVAGQCRPLAGGDLGSTASDLATGTPSDLTLVIPDGWSPDALAASCSFNGDGILDRSEAPFIVGLGGLFAVNPSGSTVAVNLTPSGGVWDFTAPVSGEGKVFDQLASPGGTWWAADFPTATHAEKLEDGQPLWGVYRATSDALQLLGVVSEQDGLSKTELTYATPIDVLRFPLSTSSQWTSESDVSGFASGAAYFGHDKYSFAVDLRGTTKVPAAQFDTLRLRINYTQTYGFLVTTRITYLHLAECYGAVARIRSQDNETSNDFNQAAEYRRLATQ